MRATIVLAFLAFASFAAAEDCFAPLNNWGPYCYANQLFSGSKGFYVNYHIIPEIENAEVYCKGLGVSQIGPTATCAWQLWDLGKIGKDYISLVWDNASAKPLIQCWAAKKPTNVKWSYTTGSSSLSCIR